MKIITLIVTGVFPSVFVKHFSFKDYEKAEAEFIEVIKERSNFDHTDEEIAEFIDVNSFEEDDWRVYMTWGELET